MLVIHKIVNRRGLFTPSKVPPEVIRNATTHELLQALGYIRQSQPGIIHWLPLGLKTLKNVEGVIRKNMNEFGAHELKFSALSPQSIWEKTGRWANSELFKLKDSKKKEYCLAATCEEEATNLMKSFLETYKTLPVTIYQIGNKYRDELRPRWGLLRGREFIMKDAYSFHLDSHDAIKTFHKINKVYNRIFKELKIPFVSAEADGGDIGNGISTEYHYLHKSGEDILYTCNSCEKVFNAEKCSSLPKVDGEWNGDVQVKYALSKGRDSLICFYYPSNRVFNWNLAQECMDNDLDTSLKNHPNDEVLRTFTESSSDPMFASIVRVMDIRLSSRSKFPDFPLQQYLKNNFSQLNGNSIVNAVSHELCGNCNRGKLEAHNSIEIGHTFHLGTKYSKPLGARTRSRDNEKKAVDMGCYGIGISRLIGAIAEVSRDDTGLRWPGPVAPYQLSLNYAEYNANVETVETFLRENKLEPFILKDKSVSIGSKVNLSNQLGIPLSVIVGIKSWPLVEIEVRGIRYSNNWIKEYESLGAKFHWKFESRNKVEKHYCLPEYVPRVINALLKDL